MGGSQWFTFGLHLILGSIPMVFLNILQKLAFCCFIDGFSYLKILYNKNYEYINVTTYIKTFCNLKIKRIISNLTEMSKTLRTREMIFLSQKKSKWKILSLLSHFHFSANICCVILQDIYVGCHWAVLEHISVHR